MSFSANSARNRDSSLWRLSMKSTCSICSTWCNTHVKFAMRKLQLQFPGRSYQIPSRDELAYPQSKACRSANIKTAVPWKSTTLVGGAGVALLVRLFLLRTDKILIAGPFRKYYRGNFHNNIKLLMKRPTLT